MAMYRHAVCAALLLPAFALCAPGAEAQATSPADVLIESAQGVVGTPAPAFRLQTIDGATIDLAEVYGSKAVYLKFWATWCVPCRQQMPHFENVFQQAGEDLEVIAINTGFNDRLEDIVEYSEELGIHMPIAIDDGALAGAFNLRITPQHVVIGKDGLIKHIGQRADAELDAVLARERNAPAVAAGAVAAGLAALPRLDAGARLPDETLRIGDDTIALADPAAHGTAIVFMIPWCESYLGNSRPAQGEGCRAVREQVETLKQQYPAVRWVGISSGIWTVAHDLATYSDTNKVTLPLALDTDGHLFRRFGVMSVPTIVIADAKGRIIKRVEGHDAALAEVISAL